MILKKKDLQPLCLTSSDIWMPAMVSYSHTHKKNLETSQEAMERKMLNAKLKDRIRHTTIRQRTRVTDIVQYVTNAKWKWAGHIARMKDSRLTVRSTVWLIKGVEASWKTKRSLER